MVRAKTVRDLAKGADALVLVTEWPEFRDIPLGPVAKLMKTAFLVDSKNYLDPARVAAAGLDTGVGSSLAQATAAAAAPVKKAKKTAGKKVSS